MVTTNLLIAVFALAALAIGFAWIHSIRDKPHRRHDGLGADGGATSGGSCNDSGGGCDAGGGDGE